MTVRELIERLKQEDPDRVVVLSQDAEGNGFDTLHTVEAMAYSDGEVGYQILTPEMKKQGYTEEDLMPDGTPALVLWP